MAGYVAFDPELKDELPSAVSAASYPKAQRYLAEAESRVRVQVGSLPARSTEDGEFVAGIIRDFALGRAMLSLAGGQRGGGLVETARELISSARDRLSIYLNESGTPDAPPEDQPTDALIGGGLDYFSDLDYDPHYTSILPITADEPSA